MDDAAALEFRRVRVRGSFVAAWPVYLDNRPHERRAGFHMLMPFRIAGSDKAVLVARGWIPRDPVDRTRLPATPAPDGEVEIEGSVRRHAARVFQFGDAAALKPGAIVQNVSVDEFAAASGLALLPFMIEQSDGAGATARSAALAARMTAWCATGRGPRMAPTSIAAMPSSGMAWRRPLSFFLS